MAVARLAKLLKLSMSRDEEVGCRGIPQLRSHLESTIGAPDLCILGEPTMMRVATGHGGKNSFIATCAGQAGHSAMAPNFVNALHLAVDLVGENRRIQAEFARTAARDGGL